MYVKEDYYNAPVDIEGEGTLDFYIEDGVYKADFVRSYLGA